MIMLGHCAMYLQPIGRQKKSLNAEIQFLPQNALQLVISPWEPGNKTIDIDLDLIHSGNIVNDLAAVCCGFKLKLHDCLA